MLMEMYMRANGKTIKQTEKGHIDIKMVLYSTDIGKMTSRYGIKLHE